MESTRKLKAIVFGSSGAVGRELIDFLLVSPHYSSVIAVGRRELDKWKEMSESSLEKFKFLKINDLSVLGSEKEVLDNIFTKEYNITNYDDVFCCLGSRTGKGDEEFIKVDRDFVIFSARLCVHYNIPHFSLVSSKGADSSSMFLYMRVKGEADDEVKKLNIPKISIFRPGAILDRDNDKRFGEMVLKYVPFIPKIKSKDLAEAILKEAVRANTTLLESKYKTIYTHADILKLNKLY